MCFLARYMSVEHGWTACVVDAPDADEARAMAVLEYGPPAASSPVQLQQLDDLPLLYRDGPLRVGSAMVVSS